jgi:hypothetical protein
MAKIFQYFVTSGSKPSYVDKITRRNSQSKAGGQGSYNPVVSFQSRVTRLEYVKGSTESGKLADLVALEKDPTSGDLFSIMEIKVERTMIDGN